MLEKPNKEEHPVIRLKPNVFRCENGTEFVCGGTPKRCPICGSTNIQIVPEVELDQCQR